MACAIDYIHQVHSYAKLIRNCGGHDIAEARRIQGLVSAAGFGQDRFLSNLLIEMYDKCKLPEDALLVFRGIRCPNQFSYNLLLAAFSHNGHLLQARELFDKMPFWDVVSWNLILTALVQSQQNEEAFVYYRMMRVEGFRSDDITFMTTLGACTGPDFLCEGQLLHAQIHESGLESHVPVATAVVQMYGKCSQVRQAVTVFEKVVAKDVMCWTTMLAVFTENGKIDEAWTIFHKMPQRNVVSWTTMLVAYAENGDLELARYLFDRIPQRDVIVWNAMVTAYVNCAALSEAREVFDAMTERSRATWNVILMGYARGGYAYATEAWETFRSMDLEGFEPDKVSFMCVIETLPGNSREAGIVHSEAIDTGAISEVSVCTALVHMYGKSGNLKRALVVFSEIRHRTVVSWNAMLTAYARKGRVCDLMEFFQEMNNAGVDVNAATFVGVLAGLSYRGLLKVGHECFLSLMSDYGIKPILDHFICMIDLLGRSGQLKEAKELIGSMPFDADSATWTALLSSSKIHNNVSDQNTCAAPDKLIDLHPLLSGPYVLLSNAYKV